MVLWSSMTVWLWIYGIHDKCIEDDVCIIRFYSTVFICGGNTMSPHYCLNVHGGVVLYTFWKKTCIFTYYVYFILYFIEMDNVAILCSSDETNTA